MKNKKVRATQNKVTGSYTIRLPKDPRSGNFIAPRKKTGQIVVVPRVAKNRQQGSVTT